MSTKQFDDYFKVEGLRSLITETIKTRDNKEVFSPGIKPQILTTLYMMHKYLPDYIIYPELIKDLCVVDKRIMPQLPFKQLNKDMTSSEFLNIVNKISIIMEVKSFRLNTKKVKKRMIDEIKSLQSIENEYNNWTNRIAEFKTGIKGTGGFHRKLIILFFVYKENYEKVKFHEINSLQRSLNEYLYPINESFDTKDKNKLLHDIVFLNGYKLCKYYSKYISIFKTYIQQIIDNRMYFEPRIIFNGSIDKTIELQFDYHLASTALVSQFQVPQHISNGNEIFTFTACLHDIRLEVPHPFIAYIHDIPFYVSFSKEKDKYGHLYMRANLIKITH